VRQEAKKMEENCWKPKKASSLSLQREHNPAHTFASRTGLHSCESKFVLF
jgi:hypothetical protein